MQLQEVDAAVEDHYWEDYSYGLIDGTTASFDTYCQDSLKLTINGVFRTWQYKMLFLPSNTAKF